ncbi:MAG: ABC transporter ATP-binding protein [Phycisphaerales bacterium]
MISTYALTRWYGPHLAVDALDLHVAAGEVVGFLGPNGAGKSTTLRMLAGSLPPSSGAAEVAGFDVARDPLKVRRRIGYLPESTPLYPEMRVTEYLRFRSRLFGMSFRERSKAIKHVLNRCWLEDVRRKPIGALSKGYRQRVGLAAAMLHSPPVLLLDEPTSGLDPAQIREVRGLIRELAGEHTIFLSTHILPEVEMTCDKVVMIARGRVRASGPLKLVQQRAHANAAYIAQINRSDAGLAIASIAGVQNIEMTPVEGDWHEARITVKPGSADLREAIAKTFMLQGVLVREMRLEQPSLEKLFIDLTSDVETGGHDVDLHSMTSQLPRTMIETSHARATSKAGSA